MASDDKLTELLSKEAAREAVLELEQRIDERLGKIDEHLIQHVDLAIDTMSKQFVSKDSFDSIHREAHEKMFDKKSNRWYIILGCIGGFIIIANFALTLIQLFGAKK
jgi:hypothetical protein